MSQSDWDEVTYLPAEQFDELMRTLDRSDDISGWLNSSRRFRGAASDEESTPQ